ncbi:hypothetical protein M948_17220 [Virgibacillus sp. CM-4]|nr:hypothetical protein M948_17220 [Virgibacillus sp. CM-4]
MKLPQQFEIYRNRLENTLIPIEVKMKNEDDEG